MKNLKKMLSITLTLLMIFSAFPFMMIQSSAESGTYGVFVYEIEDGEVTISACSAVFDELIIPQQINGYPVTAIADGAFTSCDATGITMPDSIKSIGRYAFSYCPNIESIVIPGSVEHMGEYAFYNCGNLTGAEINGSIVVEYGSFENCWNLSSVTLADGVSALEEDSFYGCSIKDIYLPSSIVRINNPFSSNDLLADIYYAGSQQQWEDTYVYDNLGADYATVHYNSQRGQLHNKQVTVLQEPTCSEPGLIEVVCSCGLDITQETPKAEHTYEYVSTVEPTCILRGYSKYKCSVCGSEMHTDFVSATGHNFVNDKCTVCGAVILEISLDEVLYTDSLDDGNIVYYRFVPESSGIYSVFSDSQKDTVGYICDADFNQIEDNDDDGDENNFLMSYDFTAGQTYYLGIRFYSPDSSGDAYIGIVSEFTSCHDIVERLVEPTCTEGGYFSEYCSRCGLETAYDYYDSLGHKFVDGYCIRCNLPENCPHEQTELINCKEPTCTEEGYTGDTVCKICGRIVELGQYVQPHYNTKEVVRVVEPRCTRDGYTVYRCTECGEEFRSDWTWKSHEKGELIKTVRATCEREGYSIYKCALCSFEFYTDWVDAIGHDAEVVKTVEPTCTHRGYTRYKCSRCLAYYNADYVSALGHDLQNGVCLRCGSSPKELPLNEFIYVPLNDETDYTDYFSFTPETTGTYTFYSDSSRDTIGSLYDEDMNLIEERDDYEFFEEGNNVGYYDQNFVITYELEAGKTYYYSVKIYSYYGNSGDYYVRLTDNFVSVHTLVYSKTVAPTCSCEGYDVYFCSRCGDEKNRNYREAYSGDHSYKDGVCEICGQIYGIYAQRDSTCVVDKDRKLIYGLSSHLNQNKLFGFYIDLSDDVWCLSNIRIGTGSKISVFDIKTDQQIDEYTFLIYGDVNGDSIYDAQDATIVNCLANGLISREQIGELYYLAADCNHDGQVDSADVLILEQAGLLLSQVDQSDPDYMESDAYAEYLSLIDQSPTADETADEPVSPITAFLTKLVDFLKKVFVYIYSIISNI